MTTYSLKMSPSLKSRIDEYQGFYNNKKGFHRGAYVNRVLVVRGLRLHNLGVKMPAYTLEGFQSRVHSVKITLHSPHFEGLLDAYLAEREQQASENNQVFSINSALIHLIELALYEFNQKKPWLALEVARISQGMSYADVAEEIGVTTSSVRRMFRQQNSKISTFKKYAAGLGLTVKVTVAVK